MTDEKKDIKTSVVEWATGQPFNNVLLCAILFAVGWGGYYSMTVAVPKHLEQIQKGYESINQSNVDERKRTIETYDKWVDRLTAKRAEVVSGVSSVASRPE